MNKHIFDWLDRKIGDNEGGEGEGGEAKGGEINPPKNEAPKPEPKSGEEKTLTQEKVNALLAEEKRKHQEKYNSVIEELNTIRETANMTAEERENLAKRIDTLKSENLTEQQKAAKRIKDLEEQLNQTSEKYKSEVNQWQKRYEDRLVRSEILNAAVDPEHEAYNSEQIYDLLAPKTVMEEVIGEEGKPTGEFKALVKMVDKNPETGEETNIKIPVKDAVKKMSDAPEKYGNLFKSNLSGGLDLSGNNTKGGNKGLDLNNYEAYVKSREKHKNAVTRRGV